MGEYKREALPHDLAPYRTEAQSMELRDFETKRPYPFLLYARSKLWDPTLIMAHRKTGAATQLVDYNIAAGGMTFVSLIRKSQTDPSDPCIYLGREPSMDVVVPVASVSSKHARFLLPDPSDAKPAWKLQDLNSRNGTYYQEHSLVADEIVILHDNEYLRLGGNLIAWFLYPGRLWHILRNEAELKKLTDL